ncbi:MAG: peptide deformylase [Ignavibacteria bacterium]|nr:peptide deformylase [Ignavibacteria bacterium]
MAIVPIYVYGQPVLRKKAKPVKAITPALVTTVENMFETMRNAQGIGLAGNQVGLLERVIVIDISEMEEGQEVPPLVLVNPEVVATEGSWVMEEGCLSIPEIRAEITRGETVTVRFTDLEGINREIEATGILGRVLLHEIDHLNGILFVDHLETAEQKTLRGRLNKISRGETETPYPISVPTLTTPESR